MPLLAHSFGEEGAKTHYDVLNVSPSSSLEEIRASYRTALLSVHPDKMGSQSLLYPNLEADVRDASRYLRVQEAWNILRDADSRALYDASVKHSREMASKRDLSVVVGEEIVLEEMEECMSETGNLEYWYPCRCSDFFVVSAKELQEAGLVFVATEEESMSLRPSEEFDDARSCDGIHPGRQRQSIVLPCGSCSLHLRVHFWLTCP